MAIWQTLLEDYFKSDAQAQFLGDAILIHPLYAQQFKLAQHNEYFDLSLAIRLMHFCFPSLHVYSMHLKAVGFGALFG
jgi:hypothetical protein